MDKQEYLKQPYIKKILFMRGQLRPGRLVRVDIRHDDWCPALRGGLCSCSPDVALLAER